MMTSLDLARKYIACGYSVVAIPPDGTKRPGYFHTESREYRAAQWGKNEDRPERNRQATKPTEAELLRMFPPGHAWGIGLVQGAVSGNAELLDFDAPDIFDTYRALCQDHGLAEVIDRCVRVRTPSGGVHLYYRLEEAPDGNTKLAMRPGPPEDAQGRTPEDMKRGGFRQDAMGQWVEVETLIETRGEGGQAVAPGSSVECHPDKKPYVLESGKFTAVPLITQEERNALFAMARACNEWVEPAAIHGPPRSRGRTESAEGKRPGEPGGIRPGDDYNDRTPDVDVVAMLTRAGWQVAGQRGEVIDLTRPGKSPKQGTSATLNACGPGVFYCFTSSASPFENEKTYPPFSVFALLECGGDFSEAARRLSHEGYGEKAKPSGRQEAGMSAGAATTPEIGVGASNGKAGRKDDLTDFFYHTDYGNAERFVKRHGKDIRYCEELGWLTYGGGRWAKDADGEVMRRAKETVRHIKRCSACVMQEAAEVQARLADIGEGGIGKEVMEKQRDALSASAKALSSWAQKSESAARLEAMISLAKSEAGISIEINAWDADLWLLNLQNGTIDLRTGELRPHDRADLLTKISPVTFDPKADCPKWRAHLERFLPDAPVRNYLARAAGYSLTGDISERVMLVFYGGGSNGKTIIVETLAFVSGDYAMATGTETLMQRRDGGIPNDVARLKGARLVHASEGDEGAVLGEGFVKAATGGDTITARFMRQEFFEFRPAFKLWFRTNHLPNVKGTDKGIWSRIALIEFRVTISEEEKRPHREVEAELRAEAAGILNWALAGCREWQEKKGLKAPDEVKKATAAYQEQSDILGQFLSEKCALGASHEVAAGALYATYVVWCESTRERPVNQRKFGAAMTERGFDRYKNSVYFYVGVGLQTDYPSQNDSSNEIVTGGTGRTGQSSSMATSEKTASFETDNGKVPPVRPVPPVDCENTPGSKRPELSDDEDPFAEDEEEEFRL